MARTEIPLVALNTTTGAPVASAQVAITYRATGSTAPWYASESGGTPNNTPATTDAAGRLTNVWVDRGSYNLAVTGPGITSYTEPYDSSPGSDNSIDTAWLADLVITNIKLAAQAVTQAKLANSSVGTAQLIDGNVTKAKAAPDTFALRPAKVLEGNGPTPGSYNWSGVSASYTTKGNRQFWMWTGSGYLPAGGGPGLHYMDLWINGSNLASNQLFVPQDNSHKSFSIQGFETNYAAGTTLTVLVRPDPNLFTDSNDFVRAMVVETF